jgi:hypothetical protein
LLSSFGDGFLNGLWFLFEEKALEKKFLVQWDLVICLCWKFWPVVFLWSVVVNEGCDLMVVMFNRIVVFLGRRLKVEG